AALAGRGAVEGDGAVLDAEAAAGVVVEDAAAGIGGEVARDGGVQQRHRAGRLVEEQAAPLTPTPLRPGERGRGEGPAVSRVARDDGPLQGQGGDVGGDAAAVAGGRVGAGGAVLHQERAGRAEDAAAVAGGGVAADGGAGEGQGAALVEDAAAGPGGRLAGG